MYTQLQELHLPITTEHLPPYCSPSVVFKLDEVVARYNISRESSKRRL